MTDSMIPRLHVCSPHLGCAPMDCDPTAPPRLHPHQFNQSELLLVLGEPQELQEPQEPQELQKPQEPVEPQESQEPQELQARFISGTEGTWQGLGGDGDRRGHDGDRATQGTMCHHLKAKGLRRTLVPQ